MNTKRLLSFVLALLCLFPLSALAANPVGTDKKYRMNQIELTEVHIPLYSQPKKDSKVILTFASQNELTYIAKTDGFYRVAFFFNEEMRVGYVPIQEGVMMDRVVRKTRVFPAGTYQVSTIPRNAAGDDTGFSFSAGYYYAAADKKKTGKIVISSDEKGAQVVSSQTFTSGIVFRVETGQYVTVQNASLRNAKFASTKTLAAFADADTTEAKKLQSAIIPPGKENDWIDKWESGPQILTPQ